VLRPPVRLNAIHCTTRADVSLERDQHTEEGSRLRKIIKGMIQELAQDHRYSDRRRLTVDGASRVRVSVRGVINRSLAQLNRLLQRQIRSIPAVTQHISTVQPGMQQKYNE